jgi:hypothetical protein
MNLIGVEEAVKRDDGVSLLIFGGDATLRLLLLFFEATPSTPPEVGRVHVV